MNYIKSIKLFENQKISISNLLDLFLKNNKSKVINWWLENRKEITNIYLFRSKPSANIFGCFLDESTICINNNMIYMPSDMVLWCILHESRHADQYRKGIFNKGYFETVLNKDIDGFLKSYKKLERDANNFAEKSFKEIGISLEPDFIKRMSSNENAGYSVYHMMRRDIERYNINTFRDLILSQIDIL